MRPRPQIGGWSSYSVLGVIGYALAAIAIGAIGAATGATLAERACAIVVPPLAFWTTIAIERSVVGVERIVFYHTAIAAWAASIAVAAALGRVAVVSDLVATLVIAFLAVGRIGCFHVACCHGRPARFGVRYTHAHADLGFPRRLVGRPLVPVQLIEAGASAVLAIAGAVAMLVDVAGTATCLIVAGYAGVRFVLELLRGDAARSYAAGSSEAQWIAIVTATAVAIGTMSLPYVLVAAALVLAAIVRVARAPALAAALREPRHVEELERAQRALVVQRDAGPVITSAGLRVSIRLMPSGLVDVLWSHERLREHDVRSLARELALDGEVLPAKTAGMYHVLVAATSSTRQTP